MLWQLLDCPRPLEFGGRVHEAQALRFDDAAQLEVLGLEASPDPLKLMPSPDFPREVSDDLLRAAWAAAQDRPEFGSPGLNRVIQEQPAAMGLLIRFVLRPHPMTLEQALGLAEAATPREWRQFWALAWGDDGAEAVVRATDERLGFGPPPRLPSGKGLTWLQVAAQLCKRWPPDVVGRITIPAGRIILAEGNRSDPLALGLVDWPAFELANQRNRARRRFWRGEDPWAGADPATIPEGARDG